LRVGSMLTEHAVVSESSVPHVVAQGSTGSHIASRFRKVEVHLSQVTPVCGVEAWA
jgi:hypothetical protein